MVFNLLLSFFDTSNSPCHLTLNPDVVVIKYSYWFHKNIQSVDSIEWERIRAESIGYAAHRRVGVLQVNNTRLSDEHTNQNIYGQYRVSVKKYSFKSVIFVENNW